MKLSKKIRIAILVFLGVIAVAFSVFVVFPLEGEVAATNFVKKEAKIVFRNTVVTADIADTEMSRERGLSGHAPLPDDRGMWFVYETSGIYSYWMPDMKFSLDMIWFDKNLRVVYIQENATPESYPKLFTPTALSQYVLEVPAGFVQKYGIAISDVVAVQNAY